MHTDSHSRLALIGFGEAASSLAEGWRAADCGPSDIRAFDTKTDHPSGAVRAAKLADYQRHGVNGCATLAEALGDATVVISLVTADQALAAATAAAEHITAGTLYFDGNSCAPSTKAAAAKLIDARGAHYIDTAVMAPIRPGLHRTPLLLAGGHATDALTVAESWQMQARVAGANIGDASSVKMIRSVIVKGLEALTAECLLAGEKAGVRDAVLDSLETSYPDFGWRERAGYMLERSMTHGLRRAAEMREVAQTVADLDLPNDMSQAIVLWQQRIGEQALSADQMLTNEPDAPAHRALAQALLARLAPDESRARSAG